MTTLSRIRTALSLTEEWFKRNQNEDFGWSRLKQTPSVDVLITLGNDPNCSEVRKGLLWLIEESDSWGNVKLKRGFRISPNSPESPYRISVCKKRVLDKEV